MVKKRSSIAVFDFDGTITSRDTFNAFLIYSFGKIRFYTFCLLRPFLFLSYIFGFIDNQSVKEAMSRHFLARISYGEFEKMAIKFASNKLPGMIRKSAVAAINKHRALGDEVVIISASLGEWIGQWSKGANIDRVLSSTLEAKKGILTGNFSYNCYGEHKKQALLKYLGKANRRDIHVYADSKGDRELLGLATHKHYRELK